MNVEMLNKIYNAFGDEASKELFRNRLMFSISKGDHRWLKNIVFSNKKLKQFKDRVVECSQENEIVIFGAGLVGKRIYQALEEIPWKCFVDSNVRDEDDNIIGDIPVISYQNFVRNYQGEYIVISSGIFQKDMVDQLNKDGINKNIINYGEIKESIWQDQYFDGDILHPTTEKEIFVDIGCYDAATSVNFAKWCKGPSFVYAFEPDFRRIEECKRNLKNNKIDYKLIDKGVWKEDGTLHFSMTREMAFASEAEEGVDIEVTSLDEALGNDKVTFIKMDIEGCELQALEGAENVIRKNNPKLAISIYHRWEDIFEIPEIILKYYPNYKLYLRHYSVACYETVLYALPEE